MPTSAAELVDPKWKGRVGWAPDAWDELVALWRSLNLQMARVMDGAPEDIRRCPRMRHNLDQIAFVVPPPEQPATLEYLMCDYVTHLEHHLAQVFHPA